MTVHMDRLSVDLRVVTPLFLGDANPNGLPELRPPSVRGALRFWWRAWHQACQPSANADDLFKAESQVFGSTDGASPLVVRLAGHGRVSQMVWPETATGLNYLLYGMNQPLPGRPVQLKYRPAYEPGSKFRITLSTRPQRGQSGQLAVDVLASLWLLCNLGGLGARTRRGAGAVQVADLAEGRWPDSLPPLDLQARSAAELCQRLSDALKRLAGTRPPTMPPSLGIPSLHPDSTWIGIFPREWPSWDAALQAVGETFRSFRNCYSLPQPGSDYHAVKAFIGSGQQPTAVKRAAFGLPLQFYYRSLPPNAPQRNKAFVTAASRQGDKLGRSASPLHFRAVQLADGRVAVLVLAFVLPLLPRGYKLALRSAMYNASPAKALDQSILAEYFDAVKAQMGSWLEVHYV